MKILLLDQSSDRCTAIDMHVLQHLFAHHWIVSSRDNNLYSYMYIKQTPEGPHPSGINGFVYTFGNECVGALGKRRVHVVADEGIFCLILLD